MRAELFRAVLCQLHGKCRAAVFTKVGFYRTRAFKISSPIPFSLGESCKRVHKEKGIVDVSGLPVIHDVEVADDPAARRSSLCSSSLGTAEIMDLNTYAYICTWVDVVLRVCLTNLLKI